MPSRTRSRKSSPQQGVRHLYQGNRYVSTATRLGLEGNEVCDDTYGQRQVINPFLLDRFEVTHALIQGETYAAPGYTYRYANWPFDVTASVIAQHLPFTLPTADAANILARTNPNRPSVSLPVFLAELRDLPSLLRHAGRLVRTGARELASVSGAARANVAYQFGMAPLLGDLSKMLDFTAIVDARRKQMEKLHRKGGLKRRVTIGRAVVTAEQGFTESAPNWTGGIRITRTEAERWATVRWKPNHSAIPSSSDLDRMAWNAAFGLNLSISDAWELLPWSWLIDWFTNIGDLLAAHRGGVSVSYGDIAVMTRVITTQTSVPMTPPPSGLKLEGGSTQRKRTTLRRAKLSTTIILPSASIPLLDASQLSILASLSILRGAR